MLSDLAQLTPRSSACRVHLCNERRHFAGVRLCGAALDRLTQSLQSRSTQVAGARLQRMRGAPNAVALPTLERCTRGVEILRYDGMPQDERGIMREGGPLIAWFTDPAGNVLSVLQER